VITEVKIKNFKSVQDLTLPLGRFNVLIGSNGSGKSNILEAIAFGGAASADKLDNEFLGSRGIRIANAQLMKSAFSKDNALSPVQLYFKNGSKEINFHIEEVDKPILKWVIKEKEDIEEGIKFILERLLNQNSTTQISDVSSEYSDKVSGLSLYLNNIITNDNSAGIAKFLDSFMLKGNFSELVFKESSYNVDLAQFIIYSPEISSLRKFEEESSIQPLGVKGEGLFSVLQLFYENENYGTKTIEEIRQYLHVIEWFDDFEAIFDKVSGRKSLVVKDRNIPDLSLNQTNVNEGFLFLLFYISLMISNETPAFFAIDNIEASFHPRLCEELIKNLVELAKKHNKQVILTTHNPFVLDGLDLNDPEQKLFVVHRNSDGETIADDIPPVKNVKLSEAWMRGYIGGQPETIE
jgi:predicted ATPase